MKLQLYRNVHNINLYKNGVFYCQSSCALIAMAYNGKSETCHLLLPHCRCFDNSFTEMVVKWSFTKHVIFVQTTQFDWLPWQPNDQIYETCIQKSTPQKPYGR